MNDSERKIVEARLRKLFPHRRINLAPLPSLNRGPLAYRELNGHEWKIEAPTDADYAHVEALRRAGRLAWSRESH